MTTPATEPTANSIQIRFPEFVTMDPAMIEFALDEARLMMGSWSAPTRNIAMMYLTAHILSVNNTASETGGRDVKHETFGRISQTFAESAQTATGGAQDLSSTAYGRRYQRLQQRIISPFKTVGHRRRTWANWWC